jgi:hypothetical protein
VQCIYIKGTHKNMATLSGLPFYLTRGTLPNIFGGKASVRINKGFIKLWRLPGCLLVGKPKSEAQLSYLKFLQLPLTFKY